MVIPTYNGREYLRLCLNSLGKSMAQPEKIIVVDDASTDDTSTVVLSEFPEIELLRHEKNKGPTAARNTGAKMAAGDFVVFIDNDILVRPDSLKNLLSFMKQTPKAGMAGGKLINRKGETVWFNMGPRSSYWKTKIAQVFDFLHFLPYFFNYRAYWLGRFVMKFNLNHWEYNRTIAVGWIIESFIVVPRKLFEELGGFDEEYFMFFEGPDLSERMLQKGYRTYFVHDAVVDVLDGHVHSHKLRGSHWRESSRRFYTKYFSRGQVL